MTPEKFSVFNPFPSIQSFSMLYTLLFVIYFSIIKYFVGENIVSMQANEVSWSAV